MAWNYRRRIKVIPGVYMNLSKSGVSTSIGVRGASLTFGKSGTYANTSIPGIGLYNRQKISNNLNSNNYNPQNIETDILEDNIFSADVQEITSQNMQGVKEAIITAHEQRRDLKNDLLKVKATLGSSKLKLTASYVLLYGLIKKEISNNIKTDIASKKEAIKQIEEQIDNCYVGLEIEFDNEIKVQYDKIVATFRNLITSHKIWDVTSAHAHDRKTTRSAASTVVNKRDVKFGMKSIPDIRSRFEALYFNNANGADLYIYPNFIVMYSSRSKFAVIGFDEIDFSHSYCRFIESGPIPRDTKVIDKTWFKVNKNGSPDKRFKGNYQIPVVKYGVITLRTKTGLNEEYQFSNYEFTEEFGRAFNEYQETIKGLSSLN
ncbi:DUF4236 domain-containing protein [Flavobacterium sp. SM15]|uniref:DUF4236 domain-containing protein n=1 Tax=Flavobacterium sp. SM15 TaxID=2908005 RepID=UPI001EDBA4AB|nr:DUF4236 domain-containing protein [Flavobacterium sp. SM15]MCG2611815.1 DUF4236 domain-containing protein [Flavobacterium sp. SM15]